jgi:estrogen-related receptor beta like 1
MSKKDSKPNDEFQFMRQVFDGLQYLDYESSFDPIHRHLPYLTPYYFALPGQSGKEQFDYFAGLCVWMMQTFLGSTIETPSDYDDPTTVADNLMLSLPQVGLKMSFSSSKVLPGHGIAICCILEALVRQSLKKRHFSPNAFRAVKGFGGSDQVETVGADEDEGLVDDTVDVQEDEDDDVLTISGYEAATDKVVDSLELKKEAERVGARLQIHIPAAKSDWRSHFTMMTQHHGKITELMGRLTPILSKVGADVTRAIEAIRTREKGLNNRFETSVSDYASRAVELERVEKAHKEKVTEVNRLQNELNSVVGQLGETKDHLNDKQKVASDNSPLLRIRTAITQLKDDIKGLELQSAILQRSLTQTWLDERELDERELNEASLR